MSGETASSATSGGDKIANPTRKLTASEKEAEDFAEKLIRESEADIVQKVQKKEDTIQVVPDAQHTDGGRGPLNKIVSQCYVFGGIR